MNLLDTLAKPCTHLLGVGPKLLQTLNKCGIETIEDLLFHLPYRYQDRTRVSTISSLTDRQWCVIEGEVTTHEVVAGKKNYFICTLQDGSGFIKLRFFHFNQRLKQQLSVGLRLRCFGEARFIGNSIEMAHPEFSAINQAPPLKTEEHLTPIYATTQGLSQNKLRGLTEQALTLISENDIDLLPKNVNKEQSMPINKILHYLHKPPPNAPMHSLLAGEHPYQQQLVLEELLAHHLSLSRVKYQLKTFKAPKLSAATTLKQRLLNSLPFQLTSAQQRVVTEIEQDLEKSSPMQRLIQGDVGCGKTLVAALAALTATSHGYQVALMAPTELLSEQLAENMRHWLTPLGITVDLLLGKQGIKARRGSLDALKSGQTQLIVGTHALFQEPVMFKQLGLIIIDEQHRFGVKQRLDLQTKGKVFDSLPHQLVMTATPIPRTLAMTQYANLDISVIDELPPGRTPINTVVINNEQRDAIIERLLHALSTGKQAYWVCTLIEESETLQCQTAEATFDLLVAALAPYNIGLVHGRMKAKDKLAVMQAFKEGQLDLLVATTVIEVGVDVPNASLMIIENAERLGLSQLHQLRGRVGRGSQKSHCLLLFQTPLSFTARTRLNVMRETTDGFTIAEEDLKLRGSGEILGTKQTGLVQLKIADFIRDKQLFAETIPTLAATLRQSYPECIGPLVRRWVKDGEKYAQN